VSEKYLVTSALPYANGPLHFGHIAGAYLPGDIFVRYARQAGHEVLYICGTDEYGAAISLSAEQAGRSPKEHVDHYHGVIKEFFDQLNVEFDNFSRTTNKYHSDIAQNFFLSLTKNGSLTPNESERQYCPTCDRYLPDRFVVGQCYIDDCGFENARGDECPKCGKFLDETKLINPRCKLYGHNTELKRTTHWQLRLDLLKEELQAWLDTKKDFWKGNVLSNVMATLKDIHARDITRDLKWGIPVPGEDAAGKVLYVWFDAPIGYISSTIEWAEKQGKPEAWREWWLNKDTKLIHFIGKDNITFHCITWPAMLLKQDEDYVLPHNVPANEFYNFEGKKFNKATGWTIDTKDFFAKYPADYIRWTIARTAPEAKDSEFTWSIFQKCVNAELNDTFGNLATRILRGFAIQKFAGVIPKAQLNDQDIEVLERVQSLHKRAGQHLSEFKVKKASETILELGFAANKYVEDQAPWKSFKADKERCGTTINVGTRLVEILALSLYPFIPESAAALWSASGRTDAVTDHTWGEFSALESDPAGRQIEKFDNPFGKLSKKEIKAEVEALHERLKQREKAKEKPDMTEDIAQESKSPTKEETPEKEQAANWKPEISYDDFMKLDMRMATVTSCEPVKGADRLLKLELQVGDETRTVVSGIREFYEAQALVGKQLVYLANLKPRKLRGVMSQGMVLAATDDGKAILLKAERDCQSGSAVS
jgi:methionyl-tRNA synthetase